MHSDPKIQGATQKVSAIRYAIGLDLFCHKQNVDTCNTRNKADKLLFEEMVGIVCSISQYYYSTNFYIPLKKHNGDYNIGSNFYSVGQVKFSRENTAARFEYPKRGGTPLFYIQDGELYRDKILYVNLNSYLESDLIKAALIVWMIRGKNIENTTQTTYNRILSVIAEMLSKEMIEVLMPNTECYKETLNSLITKFVVEPTILTPEDILGIFQEQSPQCSASLQKIFFGTPGSGKSYRVKVLTEKNRVHRTTFHPDSDYASFVGCYKPTMKDGEISYSFTPQVFTEAYVDAWKNPEEEVYLVIEEINRGNCAQIFGDLFQLLDRNSDGYSDYPITVDSDLRDYLYSQLDKEHEGIKDGKLCLPPNLRIFATMNTSDQSLFPMDSAFKRRWDWEYVPVDYRKPESNFTITLGEEKYSWLEFLQTINQRIFKAINSEDKQMGNFFIKADVSESEFKSKVMFYLWNEVCRDEYGTQNNFFRFMQNDKDIIEFSFNDLYQEDGCEKLQGFMAYLGVPPLSLTEGTKEEQEEPEQD